jgi:hypothetical protein
VVVEAEDGTVRIHYNNHDVPATAFEKDGNVTQQDVEDNKRLGHILEQVRQKQLDTSRRQLVSRNRSLREKKRLEDSITLRRQSAPPPRNTSPAAPITTPSQSA